MNEPLSGKVAIVTGAGRNIGQEDAFALARAGASVLVNDVVDPDETVAAIRDFGGTAVADETDMSSWQAGERLVAAAIEAFGRIDILVNNAAIVRPTPIDQMTEELWDAVQNVSLKAYASAIRHAAPHFIAQKSGIIVNTGSMSGLGHVHMSNYTAAKEGVVGLSRTVARDLGRYGVRCNVVRPISLVTNTGTPEVMQTVELSNELGFPITGARHPVLHPEEFIPSGAQVAALVLLLCLPETAHVSGQDFFVMGEEIGRLREPEVIGLQFNRGGWTTEALLDAPVLDNLVGDIRNRYIKS